MSQDKTNILVNYIVINSHQIFTHGYFKVFCHLQLLFYSDAFLIVKFIDKMLQVHLSPCTLARLQDIKSWMHISQLQKAFPDIWS